MTTRTLLEKLINLILESDEASSDWSNHTPLFRCVSVQVILMVLLVLVGFASTVVLTDFLTNSVTATLIYRTTMVVLALANVIAVIITVYYYSSYVFSKRGRMYLQNVLLFYTLSVLFFGVAYFYLYLLHPVLFVINPPSMAIPSSLGRVSRALRFEFFLYSGLQSVNGGYYRIHPNSSIISVLAFAQTLFTIVLVSLLIASYVNDKTNRGGAQK